MLVRRGGVGEGRNTRGKNGAPSIDRKNPSVIVCKGKPVLRKGKKTGKKKEKRKGKDTIAESVGKENRPVAWGNPPAKGQPVVHHGRRLLAL